MTPPKNLFSRSRQKLSAFASSIFERRAIVLVGLIVLAALPGLVQFEWRGSNEPDSKRSTLGRHSSSDRLPARAERSTRMFKDSANAGVEWESYSNLAVSDEQESGDFDCMIEPWETVSVRSPIIGRIDAIHVERADLVSKGDLLVELDADLSKAELEMARKRAEMTASIRAFEAKSLLGSKRSKRAQELFARDAMALDERDAILLEKKVSDYDLQEARDQHNLARLQLDREEAHFQQRRIKSPFDGVVADRLMSVGEVVDEETVLELAQIDPLRVEVILPAKTGAQAGVIAPGINHILAPQSGLLTRPLLCQSSA